MNTAIRNQDVCANCKYLKDVYRHPENKRVGKGAITDRLGYVCTVPEQQYIFFSDKKGTCELFTPKNLQP